MGGPAPATCAALLATLLLAACAAIHDVPTASQPSPERTASPTPGETPAATPTARARVRLSAPGLPYNADDILTAMIGSNRPGGVPDELETSVVAAAVADQAWTWDGQPWAAISVAAACGPAGCTLDVAGTPAAAAGSDLYSFGVEPASGDVTLLATDLHGHPAALERRLDALVRDLLPRGRLAGLALVGARWLPPPDIDHYWLAYRSGGEEGAPALDVLLDAAGGEIVEVRRP